MKNVLKVEKETPLLAFLFEKLTEMKKTRVRQFLKYGCVVVNQKVVTQFDHPVAPGDEVRLVTNKARAITPSVLFHIQVIFEDPYLIAIHKPAGLLSIATDNIQRETAIFAVNDYLNKKAAVGKHRAPKYQKRVFIVHRLDRDVSGLMLLAKSEEVKFQLQEDWNQFTKEYCAVVEGCPRKTSGTVISYLSENKILRIVSGPPRPDAKEAITHYEVMKAGADYSMLAVQLGTGRKHQIRVQLAEIGCPIAGDKAYGAKTNPLRRIALHAHRMNLIHPVTGQALDLTCPIPESFKKLVREVRE